MCDELEKCPYCEVEPLMLIMHKQVGGTPQAPELEELESPYLYACENIECDVSPSTAYYNSHREARAAWNKLAGKSNG